MDPLILPALHRLANPSAIVGQVLGFNSVDAAAPLQPCSYPRLEDTCSVDPPTESHDRMADDPEFQGLGTSEDSTGLEAALRNSSLDVCKDVVPRGRSSDDDDDRGQDLQERCQMDDYAGVPIVDFAGASENPLPNSAGISRQGGNHALANKEGIMEVDLVDYECDPYESALHDQALTVDSVFCI